MTLQLVLSSRWDAQSTANAIRYHVQYTIKLNILIRRHDMRVSRVMVHRGFICISIVGTRQRRDNELSICLLFYKFMFLVSVTFLSHMEKFKSDLCKEKKKKKGFFAPTTSLHLLSFFSFLFPLVLLDSFLRAFYVASSPFPFSFFFFALVDA